MSAPETIARLFAARTAAHMNHLQTKSFAEHKALDSFYTDIVDLSDSFAETYQGIYGLIASYPSVSLPSGKAVDWIQSLRDWLKKTKAASCKDASELGNIHDEICALCASTLYKLKYLDNPAMEEAEEESKEEFLKMSEW